MDIRYYLYGYMLYCYIGNLEFNIYYSGLTRGGVFKIRRCLYSWIFYMNIENVFIFI